MKSKKEIQQHLINYIEFDNGETLSWLGGLADDAFLHETDEGYLASILIHHQLAENLLINLIEKSNLFIQAAVYPAKYPDLFEKQKERKKFSQWMAMLNQYSIEFPKKRKILQLAKVLNDIRNDFAHKVATGHIYEVELKAEVCQSKFEELFDTWKESSTFFYKAFKEQAKVLEGKR